MEPQGIFVDGRRPTSKKQIREAVAADPSRVEVEKVMLFESGEYGGLVSDIPAGSKMITFVGPDPYTKRNFYGNIIVKQDGKVVVK